MNVLASSSLRATRPALKMIQRRNIWVPHTVQPHTNTNVRVRVMVFLFHHADTNLLAHAVQLPEQEGVHI